jgi:hypothetical protein
MRAIWQPCAKLCSALNSNHKTKVRSEDFSPQKKPDKNPHSKTKVRSEDFSPQKKPDKNPYTVKQRFVVRTLVLRKRRTKVLTKNLFYCNS